jgi:hypothetical protein
LVILNIAYSVETAIKIERRRVVRGIRIRKNCLAIAGQLKAMDADLD